MRADRLLALLMLLQTRGRLTVTRLARELEVTERTIYRDIYALRVAGFPVNTFPGRGGGCELTEDYRMRLTGLTPEEASAFLLISIPGEVTELGLGKALRSALLKLTAAIPHTHHGSRERMMARVHLDSAPSTIKSLASSCLREIHQAVMKDEKIVLTLQRSFDTHVVRIAEPLGLVAKASDWHLVWQMKSGEVKVDQVTNVLHVERAGEKFERPVDFDLVRFWERWSLGLEQNRPSYRVRLSVAEPAMGWVCRFGERMTLISDAPACGDGLSGHTIVEIGFATLEEARSTILGLGKAAEVLEPEALRLTVADYAEQILALYNC